LASHFSLAISEDRDFNVQVTSSRFGSSSAGLEEEESSSLYLFLSLSDLFYIFSDAKMLYSTSMATSCIDNKVVYLLSLDMRKNSTSNAFEKVILVEASVGLISPGILLYILLNLLVKYATD
jgi:hypothetical protein